MIKCLSCASWSPVLIVNFIFNIRLVKFLVNYSFTGIKRSICLWILQKWHLTIYLWLAYVDFFKEINARFICGTYEFFSHTFIFKNSSSYWWEIVSNSYINVLIYSILNIEYPYVFFSLASFDLSAALKEVDKDMRQLTFTRMNIWTKETSVNKNWFDKIILWKVIKIDCDFFF